MQCGAIGESLVCPGKLTDCQFKLLLGTKNSKKKDQENLLIAYGPCEDSLWRQFCMLNDVEID